MELGMMFSRSSKHVGLKLCTSRPRNYRTWKLPYVTQCGPSVQSLNQNSAPLLNRNKYRRTYASWTPDTSSPFQSRFSHSTNSQSLDYPKSNLVKSLVPLNVVTPSRSHFTSNDKDQSTEEASGRVGSLNNIVPKTQAPASSTSSSSSPNSHGQIDVICGPMFAGKSTELLKRVSQAQEDNKRVLLIKSQVDDRYSCRSIVTHDGLEMDCISVSRLSQLSSLLSPSELQDPQVVAIDEAQFFDDLVGFCLESAEERMQHVLVAGLDGDFERRKFGQILDLIPLADSVTKLTANCNSCGRPALFSLRTVDDSRKTLVGGSDLYMPACRRCYHKRQPSSREGELKDVDDRTQNV